MYRKWKKWMWEEITLSWVSTEAPALSNKETHSLWPNFAAKINDELPFWKKKCKRTKHFNRRFLKPCLECSPLLQRTIAKIPHQGIHSTPPVSKVRIHSEWRKKKKKKNKKDREEAILCCAVQFTVEQIRIKTSKQTNKHTDKKKFFLSVTMSWVFTVAPALINIETHSLWPFHAA